MADDKPDESGIKKRDDGFYEVPGVTGYFTKEHAERVAAQVAEGRKAAESASTDDDKTAGK